MNKEYKPSVTEIVNELFNSTYNYLGGSKAFKKAGKEFLNVAVGVGTLPYFLTTNIRYYIDELDPLLDGESSYSPAEVIGNFAGLVTGLSLMIKQCNSDIYRLDNDITSSINPVFAILTANVLSLGYEVVRSTRKKLIDKHNSETIN